jgi:hypothetical protein
MSLQAYIGLFGDYSIYYSNPALRRPHERVERRIGKPESLSLRPASVSEAIIGSALVLAASPHSEP